MKKILIILVAALALPAPSQAQFLKKLGKALGEVGEVAVDALVNADNSNDSSKKKSKSKKKTSDKQTTSTTEVATDGVDRTFAVVATNYSSFAVLNTEGVNLRKAADAKSGKLMEYVSYNEYGEPICTYFFSDDNHGQYRTNANAGTSVEAFHFPKGFMAPTIMEMDGWTSLDVKFVMPDVDGVFVSTKFCDYLTVETLDDQLVCPTHERTDPSEENVKIVLKDIYCRTTGKFTDLPFAVSLGESQYNEYGFQIRLLFPIKVSERYIYVKECSMYVEVSNTSSPKLEWQLAPSIYDDDDTQELHLTMPHSSAQKVESDVAAIFMNLDEATFTSIIDKIFTYKAVDETGANWFKADDGKYYCASNAVESPFFVNKTKVVTIGTGKKYQE